MEFAKPAFAKLSIWKKILLDIYKTSHLSITPFPALENSRVWRGDRRLNNHLEHRDVGVRSNQREHDTLCLEGMERKGA